ncbi:MAG: c-type cytochrome [Ilumatobacteraceae bacterium]
MRRLGLLSLPAIAAAAVLGACAGAESTVDVSALSPEARRGYEISQNAGCGACHGDGGEGRVGPKWVGLYGSSVALGDGTTVTADEEYLVRAIVEPAAQRRRGVTSVMPSNNLTDDEVAAVVEYIKALAEG